MVVRVAAYIQPLRTVAPCTGVGRHANEILTRLHGKSGVGLQLLASDKWRGADGRLNIETPLRALEPLWVHVDLEKMERRWKIFGAPRLDRYISHDIDWVYCPMETFVPFVRGRVAMTVHDVHQFESHLPGALGVQGLLNRARWAIWLSRALGASNIVVTVSEFTKSRLVKLFAIKPEKIFVIGNGVDSAFFSTSVAPPRLQVDAPYALVVGGTRASKGGPNVLAAAARLRKMGSPIQIVVAGGSNPEWLVRRAIRMGNIRFLGKIDDFELRRWLQHASNLLFLSEYEGFGIPVLEAMAAGAPVVASRRASIPEVVGDAGLLVEPSSVEETVDAIIRLQGSSNFRNELIAKGRARAKCFSWDDVANRLVECLSSLS